MKVFAVLCFTALSFGLLGCPEDAPKPDPSKASAKPAAPATSAAPATAPASTKKTDDQGSGW